jgi:hypothetical protein
MASPPRPDPSSLSSSALRQSGVYGFVSQAQAQYVGIPTSDAACQSDDAAGVGKTVVNAFTDLAGIFDLEKSQGLNIWARSAEAALERAQHPESPMEEGARSASVSSLASSTDEAPQSVMDVMIDFCTDLKRYLQIVQRREAKQYLAAAADDDEAAAPADVVLDVKKSATELFAEKQERILQLELEAVRQKKAHQVQTTLLETKHREGVRFEVHLQLEQMKQTGGVHGRMDGKGMKLEIATLTNKLAMRDAIIRKMETRAAEASAELGEREAEVGNFEVALMVIQADREQRAEDEQRAAVCSSARIDASIASLNSKVGLFAETVLQYANNMRDLEHEHRGALVRLAASHTDMLKALEAQLERYRGDLKLRDAQYVDLMTEHTKVTGRHAVRLQQLSRNNLAFIDAHSSHSVVPAAVARQQQQQQQQKHSPRRPSSSSSTVFGTTPVPPTPPRATGTPPSRGSFRHPGTASRQPSLRKAQSFAPGAPPPISRATSLANMFRGFDDEPVT